MADRGYFSRGAPAPRVRDPETLVGESGPAHGPGAVGSILPGYALRPPAEGSHAGGRTASSVVQQGTSDLLRCPGVGAQGAVDPGGAFLRVAPRNRHGKSPTRVRRAANRRCLLRGVNGQSPAKRIEAWKPIVYVGT